MTDQAVLMLIPVLPAVSVSDADPLALVMLAQESAMPRLSADSNCSASETVLQFGSSETAFMTHHDLLLQRAVADSRQVDDRIHARKAVPQDRKAVPQDRDYRKATARLFPKTATPATTCAQAPGSHPPSSWDRPRQDPPPDCVRSSFPDRPASSTPRRNDNDHIHETDRLQQQMQYLLAQLAKEHASKNLPTTRSANMAAESF